jgi:hypothetical protein
MGLSGARGMRSASLCPPAALAGLPLTGSRSGRLLGLLFCGQDKGLQRVRIGREETRQSILGRPFKRLRLRLRSGRSFARNVGPEQVFRALSASLTCAPDR